MWEQLRSNRRRSAAVVAGLGVLLVTAGAALGAGLAGEPAAALLGAAGALVVWLVLWATAAARGDRILLGLAGAREIQKEHHPRLVNVVEEMSIAAALPGPPRVFLVDDPAPNAFATGRDPARSAVAVTTGLLRLLDRDELQGVVAHEIGHVRNRDVALLTTAGVMLGSIVMLSDVGARVLFHGGGRRSRSSSDGGHPALLLVGLLTLILAPILAQLLYFALSRRREYLADASGALFTRYPPGLASALEKIGASGRPLADQSRVTAPMYIVAPLRGDERRARRAASAFSTHPPLDERVRVLRAMSGGAGLADYESAFRRVSGRGCLQERTIDEARRAPLREAGPPDAESPPQRARAASDAMLGAAGYAALTCPRCGARSKVPPRLIGQVKICLRCRAPL